MADQKDAVAEVSTPKKIANFFKESKVELHKVTWPTKRELLVDTAVVLVAVAIVVADTVFSTAIRLLLR